MAAITPTPPGPANNGVAVTPSDTTVYTPPLRSLWVGGAGNVAILCAGDTTAVTLTGVAAGTKIDIASIQKVMATNTTATLIVGFR